MSPHLEALLLERFRPVFSALVKSGEGAPSSEAIACGDGWFTIIETLCVELTFDFVQAQVRLDRLRERPSEGS